MAVTVNNLSSTREKLMRAKEASAQVGQLSTEQKNSILRAMAEAIEREAASILKANAVDLETSRLAGPMRDRLLLTAERIQGMAQGVRDVAKLADPVRECIAEWRRPNGLLIRKVRVPLGVVGIIYESRPNVPVEYAWLWL